MQALRERYASDRLAIAHESLQALETTLATQIQPNAAVADVVTLVPHAPRVLPNVFAPTIQFPLPLPPLRQRHP